MTIQKLSNRTLNLILAFFLGWSIVLQSPESLASSQDPILTIQTPQENKTYTRSELLQRKDLEKLTLSNTPTYPGQKITFSALPLHHLFGNASLEDDATLLFRCQDGFSAPMDHHRLLNSSPKHSIAYLAIENPSEPWPKIKTGSTFSSPGPFYLIWKNAAASQIKTEEWPYQVTHFEVQASLRKSYPQIYPSTHFFPDHPVMKGLKVFTQNCFTCHTLNLQGAAHFGPDLNYPSNPTEYLKPDYLRKFIRNPQTVRYWKEDRMKGFSPSEISDQDLSHLLQYLKEMSRHRISKEPTP